MSESLYARARVALAVVAQQTADLCRGIVGDVSTPMRPGERIRKVRRVRLNSLSLVDRAVLAELSDGTTWDEVADALGLDETAARRRYQPVWDEWAAGDFDADTDFGDFTIGMPGDHDLAGTAQMLDGWYRRHAEPWESADPDVRPVAQALVDGEASAGDR